MPPPLYAAVLIGGRSRRMGTAKHLLTHEGRTWLERTLAVLDAVAAHRVIVGDGAVPPALATVARLADAADAQGPLAGILAAIRSAPHAAWLITACDFPRLSVAAAAWLVAQRQAGRGAVVPMFAGSRDLQPLFAIYEPSMQPAFAAAATTRCWRMMRIVHEAACDGVALPPELEATLCNANAPVA